MSPYLWGLWGEPSGQRRDDGNMVPPQRSRRRWGHSTPGAVRQRPRKGFLSVLASGSSTPCWRDVGMMAPCRWGKGRAGGDNVGTSHAYYP